MGRLTWGGSHSVALGQGRDQDLAKEGMVGIDAFFAKLEEADRQDAEMRNRLLPPSSVVLIGCVEPS